MSLKLTDHGTIVALQVCPGHRKPMISRDVLSFEKDLGIKGDMHALPGSSRQVLAIEQETLDQFELPIGLIKENITTTGIDLMALKRKQRIAVGETVVLEVVKGCAPCSRMDEIRPGLLRALEGKRGMLFRVIHGGDVHIGDSILVLIPETIV